MEVFKISGGTPLQGTVKAAGAKNAITKMLVASLLSNKKCIFFNVPNIIEVKITLQLCRILGMEATWNQEEGILEVETKEIKTSHIPFSFSGSNRIPILTLGALLTRTREEILIPAIGGCNIGKRPVNFHLSALESLGAIVTKQSKEGKEIIYSARAPEGLKGNIIHFPYPSVMATENAILAACKAKGKTVIRNAAIEPEIIDLILFLQKLGAIIHIDTNRTLYIQETKTFYEVEHTVIPDRIEAACFGMAAISTKGRVFVEGAEQVNMLTFLNKLREIGGGFHIKENGIEFFYVQPLKGGLHLETDVHPGFLTDWQQPFVVLLTQARGSSVIHETVYENRFGYIQTLKKMGADIELFTQCLGDRHCRFASLNYEHSLIVKGPTSFKADSIQIPDLRGGFAYIMAALLAPGTSTVSGLSFLDRGYERLETKLQLLGANIKRIKEDPPYKKTVKEKATLHSVLTR